MWNLTDTLSGIGDAFDQTRRLGVVSYGLELGRIAALERRFRPGRPGLDQ